MQLSEYVNQDEEGRGAGVQEEALIDPDTLPTMHLYPMNGGLLLISESALRKQQGQGEDEAAPLKPEESPAQAKTKKSLFFLMYLLILLFSLLFDMVDTALLTPTVTITVIPQVRSITLHSTAQLGKLLSPITLSESQTVPSTGRRHQDARAATGQLTFYNAAFTPQTVDAGALFTGSDGVQVVTDAPITVPANNPPQDGQASIAAHTVSPGANGNIQAFDINGTFTSSLYVKNLAPFTHGQNERDYKVVTQADIATTAATLKKKVSASMHAALQGQLTPTQQLQPMPCTPITTADHRIGDEAVQVQISVSETCTAIAYNIQQLTVQATRQLNAQAAKTVGKGYMLYGKVHVTITRATTQQQQTVVLAFTCQGTWVYQIHEAEVKTLVNGKPRLDALHLVSGMPGVQTVTITGIHDNELLPDDQTHIHVLIITEE